MPAALQWTVQEALVAILFSAATADGDLTDTEREELLLFEHRSKLLKMLSSEDLNALNRKVVERLRYGEGVLAQACAALPPDARLPAFANALDLMLACGELTAGEADLVNTLVLHLDLKAQEVEQVADVVAIKNRI